MIFFYVSIVDTGASSSPLSEATIAERLQGINQLYLEEEVAKKAKTLGYGYVDLTKLPINPDYLRLVPYLQAKESGVVCFYSVGKKLRIGVVELHARAQQEITRLESDGFTVQVHLVSPASLTYALGLYEKFRLLPEVKEEATAEERIVRAYQKELDDLKVLQGRIETVSPEEGLALIQAGAVRTGASDIHFQPEEEMVLVRLRIDGVLRDAMHLSRKIYDELIRQVKYRARMKVNVTKLPQDGRYYFDFQDKEIQVRVSSLPTDFGETFVLRILDNTKGIKNFHELGFEGYNLSTLYRALSKSTGVILLTGPTGSGKTTTLYSILHTMNAPEKKIATLEDPVEYRLPYLSQSQIDENNGYTFSVGLRAILRQDPDVVMLGEIRDLETAEIAMQASLTGHVVLSTLHTNNSVEAIPRLINMGLPSYIVAPGLTCIIAQRLVRKLCPHCAKEVVIPERERKTIEHIVAEMKEFHPQYDFKIPETIKEPGGCEHCSRTGYLGQLALIEVFYVDREIKDMIFKGALVSELLEAARRKGMFTIMEVGLVRVFQGLTTLSEVYRVGKL